MANLALQAGTGYGAFSYNGLDLAQGTDTIKVRSEKIRDDSGRTVLYHRITITWTGVLAVSDPTNANASLRTVENDLTAMRDRLSQDGQELLFQSKGFGRVISVNKPGNHRKDVNFGPKTEELEWESLGGPYAARVVWRVVVCIPECPHGTSDKRFDGVMAINYDVAHTYNDRGSLTRVYNGYIQIAMTRGTAAGQKNRIPD